MSLKLYRPVPGGLEPSQEPDRNWRRRLLSRRWRAARLDNPEALEPSPYGAVLLFGGLAVMTFVVLVFGYGIGLWA